MPVTVSGTGSPAGMPGSTRHGNTQFRGPRPGRQARGTARPGATATVPGSAVVGLGELKLRITPPVSGLPGPGCALPPGRVTPGRHGHGAGP